MGRGAKTRRVSENTTVSEWWWWRVKRARMDGRERIGAKQEQKAEVKQGAARGDQALGLCVMAPCAGD
jgi:hypothetical protein